MQALHVGTFSPMASDDVARSVDSDGTPADWITPFGIAPPPPVRPITVSGGITVINNAGTPDETVEKREFTPMDPECSPRLRMLRDFLLGKRPRPVALRPLVRDVLFSSVASVAPQIDRASVTDKATADIVAVAVLIIRPVQFTNPDGSEGNRVPPELLQTELTGR